jgi:hypothetical protein
VHPHAFSASWAEYIIIDANENSFQEKTAKTPFYKDLPARLDQPVSDPMDMLEGHQLLCFLSFFISVLNY